MENYYHDEEQQNQQEEETRADGVVVTGSRLREQAERLIRRVEQARNERKEASGVALATPKPDHQRRHQIIAANLACVAPPLRHSPS